MADPRARARELARASIEAGDVVGWFERLYTESAREGFAISWVDLAPNAFLVRWLERWPADRPKGRALVVGCGYGDDAELLAARGFDVVAFDVAPSAVARCGERFPGSAVRYVVADALQLPREWERAFDFVFEAYTIQVLPGKARLIAAEAVGRTVAAGGRLLAVARSRTANDPVGSMPWPLTRRELDSFAVSGLELAELEELVEAGEPPVPRFVAEFVRPA
jgi:SAM-dependent methyltransferase